MPMLPVPAFVALVLGCLALKTLRSEARGLRAAFLMACAVQSLLVALVGGYGIDVLRPLLPVTATLIPPLAWITFHDALVRRQPLRAMAGHLAAPAFTLFCRVFAPETTDVVVPVVFAGYGGAILLSLRRSPDMPLARLEAGGRPVLIWQVVGGALIASAFSDVAIALAYLTGNSGWTGWMITVSSSLLLLMLGLLSGDPAAVGTDAGADDTRPAPPRAPDAADGDILVRIDALLAREPLHLDPNLNLTRLARRLHLPEKRLSAAINRATGANVSRYINTWRIRHACDMIAAGASVTDAMLEAGFNTKSNFNREFLRVTGTSPRRWQPARHP